MQRTVTKQQSTLLCLFLFLFQAVMVAQEMLPLTQIIKELEQKHEVRFSFVETEITGIEVVSPNPNTSLTESIEHLNSKSPFQFVKINDRYYSISKKEVVASNYCGKIIDGSSGLPLENATVLIGENKYATVTNAQGIFYVPNSYISEDISITFIGFETLNVTSNFISANCPEIILFPTISRLNEVLISNVLVRGINRNVNGSTSLGTQNFGLLPGQTENDVLQMVQALPGVESSNETISTINIRGGANDENLILWEGIRMYQTGHFFGLISAFNPNLTKEVSVYKNGTPAMFGESVSGVIDMTSSNTISKKFKGGIGINLLNANAFLEMPLSENVGIQISGRSSINELFETPVYTSFSNRVFQETEITNFSNPEVVSNLQTNEFFHFFDVGGKVLWDVTKKDKIRFNFIVLENHFEYTERLFTDEETSSLKQKSEVGGFSWERKWNSKFMTEATTSLSHYLLLANKQDILTTQEIYQENEVLELSAKLNTRSKLSNTLQLQSGYHFSEVGIANTQDVNLPRFRDYEKNVLRSHSVYGELLYASLNKKTRINGGLRSNYFEKLNEFIIEPRFNLYQELAKGFAIELAGEFKSQTTTQRIDLQSDFLGVEKRRWVLADNEDVPVKKSKQGSLGLLYNTNGWFINTEGYYKEVKGITSKSQGFQNQYQFSTEIGNYSVKGMEVIINKKVNEFSGWISYAYSKNTYDFENFSPQNFPNNIDITHTITLASSYQIKKLKIATGINWRTGKPFTSPSTEPLLFEDSAIVIPYNTPNQERLPEYLRIDFSAEYLWELSQKLEVKLNLALLNITHQDNILNRRFSLKDASSIDSEINQIEEHSLGFTPNFSIQFLF
ncbi:MAG: TonB-dependent receptor plug domain-containing protein [Flavobacteriaceae bacterium]